MAGKPTRVLITETLIERRQLLDRRGKLESNHTESLISRLRYCGTTPEVAYKAGRLKYDWARKGHTLSLANVLIAATARHYRLRLMTDNVKLFTMPDLSVQGVGRGLQ